MVSKLDIPVRQVLIEVRIVEAQDTFGKSLGIRLGGVDLRGVRGGEAGWGLNNTNRIAGAGTYEAIGGTTGQTSTALDALNTTLVNLPAIGVGGYAPATFAVSLFSYAANRFLNMAVFGAGSGWQGQDRGQPTRGHRRSDQGLDRAGHGISLPAGHQQRCNVHGIQEGDPQAGGHAADHA